MTLGFGNRQKFFNSSFVVSLTCTFCYYGNIPFIIKRLQSAARAGLYNLHSNTTLM